MEYTLKGGALIIGSLYWQRHLNLEKLDLKRERWRKERLHVEQVVDVAVPIRYGRFSTSGSKQAYTMIFDNTLRKDQFGNAKVLPLKRTIHNFDALKTEVEELSEAEGKDRNFLKGTPAWCFCTIIFNPKVEDSIRKSILTDWKKELEKNEEYLSCDKDFKEYCVKPSGELDIPWPAEANEFDFLLAAATKPQLRQGVDELTHEEIAQYVGSRPYFGPNVAHGITTYQDDFISEIVNAPLQSPGKSLKTGT